ncbi:N-acetylneuraminate synthase [Candidatus Gottesmanbacteria bacterium RBG_13_37_7]|uniref:N-acetylneuraminate synthase n=1 Tax=Candidatus Gottesmanbacteria bacterium RBG_13_37_7 TaxID=1798369 RepID=A0A1F5YH54_9BACT|nr:MAG: N-acetylneuraminate synthase [Candidatus Gottesmanbacteria bacterium RBG_13_37_7]
MTRRLQIGLKEISDSSDCFIIAEIGHNHQGDLELCKKMFKAAKECGVDAVKLQKRHNKNLYTKHFLKTPYNSENAFGKTYGLHREALEFGLKEYQELKEYANRLNLIFFATAFDFESADFLDELDMPCFKIASGDLVNLPLLKHIARKNKPMIISTGGATMKEIRHAYEAVWEINKKFAFLHCTASYPNQFDELDLNVINTYKIKFPENIIGWSSHDNGIAMALAAYVLGARIIEKHFTLNHAMKGSDHACSLEPIGMRKMVRDLHRARIALGDGRKKVYESEKNSLLKMRKKIVASRNLKKGHIIKEGDLAFKSPGDGLMPYHVDYFYGKKLKINLKEDDNLKFKYV